MAEMGILSRSGRPFTPSTLKGIISNPANIGKVRWGHRKTVRTVKDGKISRSRPHSSDYILADAVWPPRISADLFQRANQPKGAAPLRCVMTDRFRIFLPVLSGVPSVAG